MWNSVSIVQIETELFLVYVGPNVQNNQMFLQRTF